MRSLFYQVRIHNMTFVFPVQTKRRARSYERKILNVGEKGELGQLYLHYQSRITEETVCNRLVDYVNKRK